jgi:hypothetical protein
MGSVAATRSPDMVQPAGDDETIQISVEADTLFRIDGIRRPRQTVRTVPANIDPTPCGTADVKTAIDGDLEPNTSCIPNHEEPLAPTGTILHLQKSYIGDAPTINGSFAQF